MSEKTQVAVVGGGPGGYAAAFLAADLGMQIALIDTESNPGGMYTYLSPSLGFNSTAPARICAGLRAVGGCFCGCVTCGRNCAWAKVAANNKRTPHAVIRGRLDMASTFRPQRFPGGYQHEGERC